MDGQTLIVISIVAGALAFVGRRAWRQVRAARRPDSGSGCGGDCGCDHR